MRYLARPDLNRSGSLISSRLPHPHFDDLAAAYHGSNQPRLAAARVAKASKLAGEKDVSIAGATITRGCADAGLLDAVQVSVVPGSSAPGSRGWLAPAARCACPIAG